VHKSNGAHRIAVPPCPSPITSHNAQGPSGPAWHQQGWMFAPFFKALSSISLSTESPPLRERAQMKYRWDSAGSRMWRRGGGELGWRLQWLSTNSILPQLCSEENTSNLSHLTTGSQGHSHQTIFFAVFNRLKILRGREEKREGDTEAEIKIETVRGRELI
jgi:hypothetical protein